MRHYVIAIIRPGKHYVVDCYPKRSTAVRVAWERTIQTGTEHTVDSV